MAHIKNIRVGNPKSVVLQLPGFITNVKWGLEENDLVEVLISENEGEIIIRPKKAQARGHADGGDQEVVGTTV